MSLTIGSLFSGIGGLELGLERAGLGPVVWQVERDAWCRGVLARHWPDARRFEDVTDFREVPHVDLICGGFPCQDISVAGTGAGLAGQRSGLWREYARIVRMVRPRFVVVENVSALLGRGLGEVLGDLAASGYDALWDCLPAAAVGAPHRRDRVFVVAWRVGYADDTGSQGRGESGGCASQRDAWATGAVADARRGGLQRIGDAGVVHGAAGEAPREAPERERLRHSACDGGTTLADADRGRLGGERQSQPTWQQGARGNEPDGRGERRTGQGARVVEPGMGGVAHGFSAGLDRVRFAGHRWPAGPAEPQAGWEASRVASGVAERVARLRALGNAVVPQVAEAVGHVVMGLVQEASP